MNYINSPSYNQAVVGAAGRPFSVHLKREYRPTKMRASQDIKKLKKKKMKCDIELLYMYVFLPKAIV